MPDYEVWTALMEDAVDRGEVQYMPPATIAGFTVPATYWNPGFERHPRVHLYDAAAMLASACACRGRLHAACVWPTIQRGEQPDMPEDWREWVRS
jgi:hypothetical protein